MAWLQFFACAAVLGTSPVAAAPEDSEEVVAPIAAEPDEFISMHRLYHPLNAAPVTDLGYRYSVDSSSPDIETDHIWMAIPSGWDVFHSNGVYASTEWHFEHGKSGYMGTQVENGLFGKENTQFIFSAWDADPYHRASYTSHWCGRFGNEGSGAKCLVKAPIKTGVKYTLRAAFTQSNGSGAFWTGTARDPSTGQTHMLGNLYLPNRPNAVGYGNVMPIFMGGFMEYWKGGNCETAVHSSVGLVGPYLHSRTAHPYQVVPNFRLCRHSDASTYIPGLPAGPTLLLMGGKGVVRHAGDLQPLRFSAANTSTEVQVIV